MEINGTLINYFFHCKRQCYLHGNKINLEDNNENVKIGKALHEIKFEDKPNAEIAFENIKLDKITNDFVLESKKSDADPEAAKWQTLFYLFKLKRVGIVRKGKIDFFEKNKNTKTIILELNENNEKELEKIIKDVKCLIESDEIPEKKLNTNQCKKCAYYEYCFI